MSRLIRKFCGIHYVEPMQDNPWRVRWVGKEAVRCEAGDVTCEVLSLFDPDQDSFHTVLHDRATRRGESVHLSFSELSQIEAALRSKLGVKRFLGVAVGKREVHVQREQHVF